MTTTSLRLQKKIPEPFPEILTVVFGVAAAHGADAFVVGATARDLIFIYVYSIATTRATGDIDFAIAVKEWNQFETIKTDLIATDKFRPDRKAEHRLWWEDRENGMKIDLIPYGDLESPAGSIAFPPAGNFVMSTIGLAEAFADALLLEIADDVTIKVASLRGLVLLKFVAYNDRPEERRRDAQDIWFIAKYYENAGNEDRLYDEAADLLDEPDFDVQTWGARLLGRDIAPLLTPESAKIVSEILTGEAEGGRLERFADVIANDAFRDEETYDFILKRLKQLKTGINEGK